MYEHVVPNVRGDGLLVALVLSILRYGVVEGLREKVSVRAAARRVPGKTARFRVDGRVLGALEQVTMILRRPSSVISPMIVC